MCACYIGGCMCACYIGAMYGCMLYRWMYGCMYLCASVHLCVSQVCV